MRPVVVAAVLALPPAVTVSQDSSASSNTVQEEGPHFETISMDSLTKLREDSIRTFARRDRGCKPDKKVVHRLARQEVMATDSLALIACGRVWVGISAYLIFDALGVPDSRNRTTTVSGTSEQWVFRSRTKPIYVYTENGRVTAIQD